MKRSERKSPGKTGARQASAKHKESATGLRNRRGVHTIDEKDREVELGKVTAVLVQFQKALADGVPLSHVCDSYSGELLHAYLTIFEEGDQPHEDLEIELCFVGFLYIESLDTKPKFAEAVIETVVNTFAPSGLIAAPYDLLMVKNWKYLMKTAFRTFAAILAGLLLAFVLVIAVEAFSAVVHPFPADFDGSQEEVCQHVERYPSWVLAVVVPAWAATAWVGVWVAHRIGNILASAIVGLLVLTALVFNVLMLPYPIWFKIANLLAVPAAMFAAIRRTRPAGD